MDSPILILSLSTAATAAAAAFPKLHARLALSRAKHRSLTGHSKMSRAVARLIPFYEFDIDDFFRSDGAPAAIASQRQDGFFRLARLYQERYVKGRAMTSDAATRISDLQFTRAYRVPFQYSRLVQEYLGTSAFVESSAGVTVTDVDGNVFYDLTGSYGVNIFGNDFYKECIANAAARAQALGPVLGSYHPVVTDNRAPYTACLKSLREFCTERGIVLIFDEFFVGFRLAAAGAKEYFDVRADMVTYGKSLAGGLPVGVVCGRKDLMRRFRDDRPADICFARGTFNSHPYVMTAMDEFLSRLASPNFSSIYHGLDETWNGRARELNAMLAKDELPVQVSNLSSIWMVEYTEPSRYNWMLQYYLRAEGLALSWVGTGRLIFSLNYADADFAEVAKRFVTPANRMKQDAGWRHHAACTNKTIRRQILKEMLAERLSR